jgi:CRP-like cAMP-binding protein
MDNKQKINILQTFSLFKNLPPSALSSFAEKTKEKKFSPKTIILNQIEPANKIYFLYKGLVNIYMLNSLGKVIPIRVKGSPYIIGEMNLFDNESTATIETLQESYTLTATKKDCLQLVMRYPDFAFNLLQALNEKLRAANKQANYFQSFDLQERTWGVIQALAPHFHNNEITLSQEELSFLVGASRARVTEMLNILAGENLITISHRKIRKV